MNRTTKLASSGLVLISAGIAAFWIWRSPEGRDAGIPGDPPVMPGREITDPTGSSVQNSTEEAPSAMVPADPSDSSAPISRKPTLGLKPEHARKSYDTRELSPEELEKHRPELERYQKAWDQHIAPLVYPPGHPQEGTYRDNVSLEDAVEAQLAYYAETSPPGYLDQPRLHVEKRIPYSEVRSLQATWDQTDLGSNRKLYDELIKLPEDPKALLSDIWLPAHPSDPDKTTRRDFLRERIRNREAAIFEQGSR